MPNSMYSLILNDELVEAVDRAAYAAGTNRSSMINRILAEYFSFTTPEQLTRDIFDHVMKLIHPDETFQIQMQPSEAMLSIRSPLRFRYNPTIRYSVELYRQGQGAVGELKVVARTQNASLIALLEEFFRVFASVESVLLKPLYENQGSLYTIRDGRLSRRLYLTAERNSLTSEQIGEGIVEYIKTLDHCLKVYFEHAGDPQSALGEIQARCKHYLKHAPIII